MKPVTACEYCGEKFDAEDGYTIDGIEGQEYLVCERCFDGELFMCALCYGYRPESQQGAIGSLLVVVDAVEAGLPEGAPEGLYEIVSHPYWYSDYISADLYPNSLRYIGPLTGNDADTDDCPVGHLCTECSTKQKEVQHGC